MTYWITGATGFIGRRLVETLLAGGHSVHYLGRRRDPTMDSRAAFYLWEPGTAPPLETMTDADAIINLAGEPVAQRWTPAVKQRIRASRVESTRQLVASMEALRVRPKALVCASAVGYYGNRGDEILNESCGPGAGFLAEVCVAWEHEAQRASEFGVRVVTVRIGVVLGAGGGALGKMLPAFRAGLGGKLGDGRQWMSWIHRDDLVRMLQWAADTPAVSGALNGTAPTPVTNAEFTKTLARTLGRVALLPAPKFVLRLMFGEMSEVLFDSTRAVPAAAQAAGFEFRFPELQAALRSLLP